MRKVPVGVLAQFGTASDVHPLSVTWEDGRIYPVEAVLDIKPARSSPDRFRYTVRIRGQDTYLYRENDRWYMESAQ